MDSLQIVTGKELDPHKVEEYWQVLYMHDLLKHRLCDKVDPTWQDVYVMLCTRHVYYIVLEDNIVGEFMMDYLAGKMFAVHFSFHPTALRLKEKIRLGRHVCMLVLNTWKDEYDSRYASTLIGLIPVQNTPAIKFAEKVGFTNIGVLPSAQHYLGKLTDAQFLVMSTGEYHGR